jgi:branched-chain amino acid transport system substrate-binding protein
VPDVYNGAVSATAPNYTAQCVAAQQAHAEAALNGDADFVFKKIAADCTRQGYNPHWISSGEAYDVTMASAPGLKENSWYEGNDLPFFVNTPAVNAMNAAVNKYYPGLVNAPNIWTGGASTEVWASGILLEDAVKAGGLGPTGTPTAAEIIKGLQSLKGDTLQGLSPPLTFTAGQPHPIDCWFTFRVQNGTPSMTNSGKPTCKQGSST